MIGPLGAHARTAGAARIEIEGGEWPLQVLATSVSERVAMDQAFVEVEPILPAGHSGSGGYGNLALIPHGKTMQTTIRNKETGQEMTAREFYEQRLRDAARRGLRLDQGTIIFKGCIEAIGVRVCAKELAQAIPAVR